MSRVNFTVGRLALFACPPSRTQAFLWDSKAPGLGLRVTSSGSRAFVFQGRLKSGQSVRITIGEPLDAAGRGVHSIPGAQQEARRLQSLIDQGKDPRQEIALQAALHESTRLEQRAKRKRFEVTGLSAWTSYCAERKHKWSARHYADHLSFSCEGGLPRKRAAGTTIPGALRSLLVKPLASIDAQAVLGWVKRERLTRPTRAQLGYRLLRGFINWCSEHPEFESIANADACRSKRVRESIGEAAARKDTLQREQLRGWFQAVRADPNVIAAAYLQCLLLTGSRREELANLRWEDVDLRWHTLRVSDKVEGERTVPLTPYVQRLLETLPRLASSPFVFSSTRSVSGRLHSATSNHARVLQRAELPHVSLHGLHRSFANLAEWVEAPVGVVAQIQGHKPSALAEKHYKSRPIDLLRMWHCRIEAWILSEAHLLPPEAGAANVPFAAAAAA